MPGGLLVAETVAEAVPCWSCQGHRGPSPQRLQPPLLGAPRQNLLLSGQEPCLLAHLLPACSALNPWERGCSPLQGGYPQRGGITAQPGDTGQHPPETPLFSPSFG